MVMTILIKTLIMMTVMVVGVIQVSKQLFIIQETCVFENTNMKHQTNKYETNKYETRNTIQETRSANRWGSSPAEPSSTFFLQRYNQDSTFTGVLLCRGNLYNAVISILADRLPGRQVWRSQQGKFIWCYQWCHKENDNHINYNNDMTVDSSSNKSENFWKGTAIT